MENSRKVAKGRVPNFIKKYCFFYFLKCLNQSTKWLKPAVAAMPNGDMNDFWNYVQDMGPNLHNGAPKHFFYQNQKRFLTAVQKSQARKRGNFSIFKEFSRIFCRKF